MTAVSSVTSKRVWSEQDWMNSRLLINSVLAFEKSTPEAQRSAVRENVHLPMQFNIREPHLGIQIETNHLFLQVKCWPDKIDRASVPVESLLLYIEVLKHGALD